jgi:hypothetical protein
MRNWETLRGKVTAGVAAALWMGTSLIGPTAARAGAPAPAEDWHTILVDEQENNAAFGSDGTLYVAATYYGTPKVAKLHAYDPMGGEKWTKTYLPKDARASNGFDVAVAPDDSVYLLAYSYIPAKKYFEISLVKYTPNGKMLWAKNQKNINPYALAVGNGAVVVVGNRGAIAHTGKDAWVRSYTPKGVVSWTKTIDAGAKKNDVAWDVALAGDGTINVVGEATPNAARPKDQSGALWRLSPAGVLKSSTYAKGSVAGSYDAWTGIARTGTRFIVGGDVNDTNSGSSPWEAMVSGSKFVMPAVLDWGVGYARIWGVAAAGPTLFETGTAPGATDDARLVALDAATRAVNWTVTLDTGDDDAGFGVAANGSQVAMVGGNRFDGFIYVYPV